MLAPWKKSYDQPRQLITKQRYYFANKVPSSQSYDLTVVMYGCKSGTIKKAGCRRIDAFELWCWRRPLDCKEIQPDHPKGNQSWIFIRRTDAEAEAPILWQPDVKKWLMEKTVMLGKIEGGGEGEDRGWDGWMASLTRWTWVWVNSRSCWWTGRPGVLQSMGLQRVGHDWTTELKWTDAVDWTVSP